MHEMSKWILVVLVTLDVAAMPDAELESLHSASNQGQFAGSQVIHAKLIAWRFVPRAAWLRWVWYRTGLLKLRRDMRKQLL